MHQLSVCERHLVPRCVVVRVRNTHPTFVDGLDLLCSECFLAAATFIAKTVFDILLIWKRANLG